MDSIQSKLAVTKMSAYFGIFKEPRGLIRVLQFVFAIFAFATAVNGRSNLSVTVSNNTDVQGTLSAEWSYPYNLKETYIVSSNQALNETGTTLSLTNDIKPSAEFFVFVGVTSMLLALAWMVIYVIMDIRYRNDDKWPLADCIITVIWTIFWIAGSSAWAKGVTNLRDQTDTATASRSLRTCGLPGITCTDKDDGTYANVIVSVIFGFLNFFLWLAGTWFVYKETKFFKSRTAQQQPGQVQAGQPPFSNIGAPGIGGTTGGIQQHQ